MVFRPNTVQQISLTDEFNRLSPRTKRIVENSFAKDFADMVFPAINEDRFAVLYSKNPATRSNTPVNFIVGAMMLKTMTGQSDDEMLEAICCDVTSDTITNLFYQSKRDTMNFSTLVLWTVF